ncbi:2OG-Fe(II) oxygenase family protein [Pelagibacteraceae bacterium]|nr:2OG-Fe(II) oxygenase family protein [Pelagibacteraceae bacterium]
MQIFNLFPLTILKDEISIDNKERELLVNEIKKMKKEDTQPSHSSNNAWTGDTKGHEFLFSRVLFENLSIKISNVIVKYLNALDINTNLLDIYYQRSWATFTEDEQSINFHTHSQSNVSFAYYLLKPENSGGIIFRSNELQNEVAKNIFTSSKLENSLINKPNAYNSDKSMFDLDEGSIIVFPSKTPHATMPNKSGKPRISISGDISIMLKESKGFEHLMPNFKNWTKFKT